MASRRGAVNVAAISLSSQSLAGRLTVSGSLRSIHAGLPKAHDPSVRSCVRLAYVVAVAADVLQLLLREHAGGCREEPSIDRNSPEEVEIRQHLSRAKH